MAETIPAHSQPDRIHPLPRPLAPFWSHKWLGFPTILSPFIGREHELRALGDLLLDPRHRLVTVTGPGGVGKTRLALEVAERLDESFPDGAAFVPLAATSDPGLVLSTVAQVLDVRDGPARPLVDVLLAALHERQFLLVLDNFEHLMRGDEPAAASVAALLEGCPKLTIMVTSRAPLRMRHEQRFITRPFSLPDASKPVSQLDPAEYEAIALFVDRARAVDHQFSLDATNTHAVIEICRWLDGLPLAIELAAAWVRVLSPEALLGRLERRLPLLRGGGHDQPPRLRTMRDAIDWSHGLLSADEHRLFRRLAVFTGGFGVEAAEWVWADRLDPSAEKTPQDASRLEPLEILASLVDKSLVQQLDPIGSITRFAMLETVREYALERLAESGEQPAIEAMHAAFYTLLVERLEPMLLGPEERHWHALLDAELGNLRATLAWSLEHDVDVALRIGGSLWAYWAWAELSTGRRWLDQALADPRAGSAPNRARALKTGAALASLAGDYAINLAWAEAAMALAMESGDRVGEAEARWMVGIPHLCAGATDVAAREFDRALALFEHASTSTDRVWAANARSTRGVLAMMSGDHELGLTLYERALAEARAVGGAGILLLILSDFAGWLLELGDIARARALLVEALELAPHHRGQWLVGATLIGLALANALENAAEIAARQLGAVERMRIQMGLAIPPHYQARIDRAAALASSALEPEAYDAAFDAGRTDPSAIIAIELDQPGAEIPRGADMHGASLGLSRREREVLALMANGWSDREIATTLYISPRTASSHVSAILRKLDANTRAAAVARAVRLGLC